MILLRTVGHGSSYMIILLLIRLRGEHIQCKSVSRFSPFELILQSARLACVLNASVCLSCYFLVKLRPNVSV